MFVISLRSETLVNASQEAGVNWDPVVHSVLSEIRNMHASLCPFSNPSTHPFLSFFLYRILNSV